MLLMQSSEIKRPTMPYLRSNSSVTLRQETHPEPLT